MSKKTTSNDDIYSDATIGDEPIGEMVRVKDFLPSPKQLVRKAEKKKITISLSNESIRFFKKEAEKHDIPYQHLIRSVLDEYSSHFNQ